MNDDHQVLLDTLKFHGHCCWASVAGVRVGLAAMRVLGVKRSGGRQLHAFVEIGEDHGGMCFGDGVRYATGCTLSKGNMDKMNLETAVGLVVGAGLPAIATVASRASPLLRGARGFTPMVNAIASSSAFSHAASQWSLSGRLPCLAACRTFPP